MSDKSGSVRFSLIMATHGRTKELEQFLSALNLQTHTNFELIVVDQNPDERLRPLLAPYENRFEVLHIRSKKGLSRARNVGLEDVSGDVVAFPDDDCRYSPDLLEKVANFLTEHPEIDGLCGRSTDGDGRSSNMGFDSGSGFINRFNVWRRAISYTIFLRVEFTRKTGFDEQLGLGAGTMWAAAEETDYLLRVLDQGASLYYDHGLLVTHPQPTEWRDTNSMRRRAYYYGCGMGRVLRNHHYPLTFVLRTLYFPLRGTALALARRNHSRARLSWSTFMGRLRGLLS